MSKVVAIAGSRGGVGSTTTAINLAIALASYTRDVSLVDANLQNPHIGLHLGASQLPIHLNHVLNGEHNILNSVYRHKSGVKIIPASLKLSDSSASLKDLRNHLRYLSSDLILLDVASGINEHSRQAISASDEVLIITTPEITSVSDSIRTIKLSRSLGKPIRGVVLSRSGSRHAMPSANVEHLLGYRIIAEIPEDIHVNMSLSKRSAVVDSFPDSPASVAYRKLAANLTNQPYREEYSHWLENLAKSLGFY